MLNRGSNLCLQVIIWEFGRDLGEFAWWISVLETSEVTLSIFIECSLDHGPSYFQREEQPFKVQTVKNCRTESSSSNTTINFVHLKSWSKLETCPSELPRQWCGTLLLFPYVKWNRSAKIKANFLCRSERYTGWLQDAVVGSFFNQRFADDIWLQKWGIPDDMFFWKSQRFPVSWSVQPWVHRRIHPKPWLRIRRYRLVVADAMGLP